MVHLIEFSFHIPAHHRLLRRRIQFGLATLLSRVINERCDAAKQTGHPSLPNEALAHTSILNLIHSFILGRNK